MLTARQCEIVAYYLRDHGEHTCPECLVEKYGVSELLRSKIDVGLVETVVVWDTTIDDSYTAEVLPITRYEIDELQSSHAYDDPENYPEDDYEQWPAEPCGHCGKDLH